MSNDHPRDHKICGRFLTGGPCSEVTLCYEYLNSPNIEVAVDKWALFGIGRGRYVTQV
jgi:hypothetical protein